MRKERALRLLRRLFPQIMGQSLSIILTALASFMFMTWIVVDVVKIEGTYLGATYETLGTLVLIVVALFFTYMYIYRKRLQEIGMLTDAIHRVSKGDFGYRIKIKRNEPMAEVYEDFNRMTAELAGVQLLRNDFINNYSHEFKTPIASIKGFAELLLEKELPADEQRLYLEIIRDESDRLSSLAKNTILLSKLETQQLVTDAEEYNLGEQLRQCAIICSQSWLDKGLEFSGDIPDMDFIGSRELLQHLWLNLLSNAVKYTPSGGEIALTLRRENENAVVTVRDTGEGMSEETRSHLFMPYYQGDPSRSTQGLGLGLAISKRIVELSGGTIEASSELGQGSEFKVRLPLRGR